MGIGDTTCNLNMSASPSRSQGRDTHPKIVPDGGEEQPHSTGTKTRACAAEFSRKSASSQKYKNRCKGMAWPRGNVHDSAQKKRVCRQKCCCATLFVSSGVIEQQERGSLVEKGREKDIEEGFLLVLQDNSSYMILSSLYLYSILLTHATRKGYHPFWAGNAHCLGLGPGGTTRPITSHLMVFRCRDSLISNILQHLLWTADRPDCC